MKLSGEPLRWLSDYQDCLAGDHGAFWQLRAEAALLEPRPRGWETWRDVRQAQALADRSAG